MSVPMSSIDSDSEVGFMCGSVGFKIRKPHKAYLVVSYKAYLVKDVKIRR
jgi:hypothetical protein